jgi:hypothetical protein
MEKHLQEQVYPYQSKYSRKKTPIQPVKKRGVDNWEEKLENAKPNDVNLPKTMEADKNNGFSCIGE